MFSSFGKLLIDLFIENYTLTGIFLIDLVIFSIIQLVGFIISFKLVGKISNLTGYNSGLMSLFHWALRIAIIVIFAVFTSETFSFIKSLFSF